jgi:hypothetical protein
MHLGLENVAPAMLRHWNGTFFKDSKLNSNDYRVFDNVWKEIGTSMAAQARYVPASMGRTLPNIEQSGSMKAEDWRNWICSYSVPFLQSHLPNNYLNHWALFVRATQLCLKNTITKLEVDEIRHLLADFVEGYEKLYYQYEDSRLPACLASFHYLLHVADAIEAMGPPRCYWQFPMERVCGMLGPLVRSRAHPYTNLSNAVLQREQLQHARFVLNYGQENPLPRSSPSSSAKSIVGPNGEVFYSSTKEIDLMESGDFTLLKKCYATMVATDDDRVKRKDIQIENRRASKWSRLLTTKGVTVGSEWALSRRSKDVSRDNTIVAIQLLADVNATKPRAPSVFEERTYYGQIQYYLVHSWRGEQHFLARVNWYRDHPLADDPLEKYGIPVYPSRWASSDLVPVSAIQRSVGTLRYHSRCIIIDSNVEITIRN